MKSWMAEEVCSLIVERGHLALVQTAIVVLLLQQFQAAAALEQHAEVLAHAEAFAIALSTTLVVLLSDRPVVADAHGALQHAELVALAHVEGLAYVQQEAGIELRVAGGAGALVGRPTSPFSVQGGHLLLVGVQLLLGDGDL
ncbi:MAG: hypothetical protein IPN38_10560 [Flavobacteriales bacterium]|nr:hypothetical protein [Flavobacteriales bacterium]